MNVKIAEELLLVSRDVLAEMESIRCSKNDDDYVAGWKSGARASLLKVNENIYSRIEKLLKEGDLSEPSSD